MRLPSLCLDAPFPTRSRLPPLEFLRIPQTAYFCNKLRELRRVLAGSPPGYPRRDRFEGGSLRRVVQRLEFEGVVHAAQGVQDELVGEPGVFGKERAVEVGAVGVQAAGALGAVFAVVAEAQDHLAQGFQVVAEVGTAAVVLETDDLAPGAVLRTADAREDVADQALLVGSPRLGVQIEDAYTRELLALGGLVGVAHELVPAADPEDDAPVLDDGPQVGALLAGEVLDEERLLPILTAAEEEEVAAGGVYALAEANVHDLHGYAAPLAALLYGDDVPAVAVEVHHVRVEVVDGELDSSHGITPFVFVAPTVISRVPSAWTAARRPSIA